MKLRKKRNAVLLLAAVLSVVMAGGITYAWFTRTIALEAAAGEFGRLDIRADFDEEDFEIDFEPGLSITAQGTLSNAGSIGAICKVTLKADTLIQSDAIGDPLNPEDFWLKEDDGNIVLALDESYLGYKETESNGDVYWYTTAAGDYYVVLYGPATADIGTAVWFDEEIGNDYQGASVSGAYKWKATQLYDGAMEKAWGITFDDLVFISNDLSGNGSAFTLDRAGDGDSPEARAAALFNVRR